MSNTITFWFFLFFLSFLFHDVLHAQCALTANAGPDQFICAPGQTVTLTGTASGAYGSVQWTPDDNMTSPNSLSTDVLVTQTTTFTLNVSGSGATSNIILDGSFGGGGVFTSDYVEGSGPTGLLPEGTYAVGTNPANFHPNFQPCVDHTSGSGNMMVVNGSTTANENVWCQTVSVDPNTVYEFGAWIASVIASNPAELQFSINGTLLGSTFNAPGSTCQWSQFFETWNSGTTTSATICIVNQNTFAGGNDFALDDITFGPVCNDTDEVTVTVLDVEAVADPFAILPCAFGQGILLSGVGSSVGPGISYEWTTGSGNIVSGGNTLTPVVNAPGLYDLTVTLTSGAVQCTETATVEVTPDVDVPYATIETPPSISCIEPLALLDGTGSSFGGNIVYQWTTLNGQLSGSTTEIQAFAAQPGNYTLTVTNILNGCTDDFSVNVASNFNFPVASAVPSGNLSCTQNSVTINGGGSTPGGLNFAWTTTNGNITSGTNNPTITVDAAGTYLLTVTNPVNGCTDTEQVTITQNATPPNATIATPAQLDCTTTSLTLNAASSSGVGVLSFLWSTSGGNIVSGGQTASPLVNAVGTYTVTVTQSSNGCSATASVNVAGDNNLPMITIATPGQLNCTTTQTTLSATATGDNPTYLWTTTGGLIVSGGNTLTPVVGAPGSYTLTVTLANGCSAVASVPLTANLTPPTVEAGQAPLLNCQSLTATLNGNGSSSGAGFTYLWSTPNGNISNGATTLMPEVGTAGTYFLTVLNTVNGCTATDSVVVLQNSSLPTISIDPVGALNCNMPILTLNASASSSGNNFTLGWTTNGGHFASGENTLTPSVDAPGVYTLTITNTASACTSTASVTVSANFNTPTTTAGPPATLTCDQPTAILGGTATNLGANNQINWTTLGGTILAGANTLTPEINAAGTYVLIVKDVDSGCSDTSQVVVVENITPPTADAGQTGLLTCTTTTLQLDGGGSSQGNGFQYIWTTTNGLIVSGADGLAPLVSAPGTYLLTVENTANGCESTASVLIGQDGDFPSVTPGAGATLTCSLNEVTLTATADTGSQFNYLWTTTDGTISSGETTLTPTVSDPGDYLLTVLNTLNGCASTAQVTVTANVVPPLANAGIPAVLSCSMSQLVLNGSGNAGNSSVAFYWSTTNGNILSGQNSATPSINAPGTYLLTVTNNGNGCTAAASVLVSQDASLPLAVAGTADDLTCVVTSVTLDGSASSQGSGFTYLWTTQNGNIQNGQTSLTPTVTSPGIYQLSVTNTANNCTTLSSVAVMLDDLPPTANAGMDGLLTCTTTAISLNGTASSVGQNFSYAWATSNGSISNGQTSLTPQVDSSGDYLLLVTNNVNGCTASSTVEVLENTTLPTAAAATPGELNCILQSLSLSGTGSSAGAGFSYLWTTQNGNIASGESTISPTVSEPGTYVLTVTNNLNGCTNSATVQVLENLVAPVSNAGPSAILTCDDTSISLDGSGSSQAGSFAYLWTTSTGNIVSGATTLAPLVDAGGDYLLTVTNLGNGCTAAAQVGVTVNQSEPAVTILQPSLLTCTEQVALLSGAGSSTGSQFVYQWSTSNGNFTGPTDVLQTAVDQPGTYFLTIENSVNGCESSAQVVVNQDMDVPLADAGQPIVLHCNLAQANLLGTTDVPLGNWLATWTTTDGDLVSGENGLMPLVAAPGTYLLTVTNAVTGCTSMDEVTVTAIVLDDFDFETQAPTCLTNAGDVVFSNIQGGMPPFQYSVNGGDNFASQAAFTGLQPGIYDLVVQDANGCELEDIANLPTPPDVLVTLEANTIIDLGESYQLNAQTNLAPAEIASVAWLQDSTLSCWDCLSPTATPLNQTTYHVKITSQEGCTAEALTTVFVKKEANIYVPNAFSPNADGLNDVFMIFAGGKNIQKIRSFLVFDRWGETIFQYFNFQPNDPVYGWDGNHRSEPLDPAVFVWFAEVELIDGSLQLLKGDVSLLR